MDTALESYHAPKSSPPTFWQIVGIPARGANLHDTLREGMSFNIYKKLVAASGLEHKALARYVGIPPATLQRRAKAGKFNVDESDRLYRFAEVFNAATELFEGDNERARQWLLNPVRGLGSRRPVEMIVTSAETEAILDLIGRLEHGVFT